MKVFTYVFIISGLMALLYFGGFVNLPTADLIGIIITNGLGGIATSTFFTKITAILTSVAIGGTIIAGLFGKSFDVNLLKAGFISWFMGAFIIDLIWLYNILNGYGTVYIMIAGLIFVPLTIGFIIAALEFWTGQD